jgi:hypothetical protein
MELEKAGYLSRCPTPSGPGGRWVWEITFCSTPATPGGEIPSPQTQPQPQPQKKPRRLPGGILEADPKTGIQHDPKNARDASALEQIRQFPAGAVAQAAAAAAAADDLGRAFPSAVLRRLRRGLARGDETPAWAQGLKTPSPGRQIIEGEAQWTD